MRLLLTIPLTIAPLIRTLRLTHHINLINRSLMSLPLLIVRFLFIFFIAGSSLAIAQQQIMSPVVGPEATTTVKTEAVSEYLDLRPYQAAAGDLSACAGDSDCLRNSEDIQIWLCVSN